MTMLQRTRLKLLIIGSGHTVAEMAQHLGKYQVWLYKRLNRSHPTLTTEQVEAICARCGATPAALDAPIYVGRDREVLAALVAGARPEDRDAASHARLAEQGLLSEHLQPLRSELPDGHVIPPLRLRAVPPEVAAALPPWAWSVPDWRAPLSEIGAQAGVSRQRVGAVMGCARRAGLL